MPKARARGQDARRAVRTAIEFELRDEQLRATVFLGHARIRTALGRRPDPGEGKTALAAQGHYRGCEARRHRRVVGFDLDRRGACAQRATGSDFEGLRENIGAR